MKLTREEMDQLVAVAIKAIKEIDPTLQPTHLRKIFSRAYKHVKKLDENKE